MNAEKYEKYKAAVDHNLKGLEHISTGACPGCAECGLEKRDCPDCEGTGQQWNDKTSCESTDCPNCHGEGKIDCSEHDRELSEQPGFSWSSCEACGSNLGGDRHPAHGFIRRDEGRDLLVHISVCSDCLYFLNYGQLDDASMMEIEGKV
jgi:hypothetical protein